MITLTLAYLADYSLIMRSSLLDELGEDYLVTARAKGLRDVEVRRKHAVRNALLPTTTLSAHQHRLRGLRAPSRSRRSSRSRGSGCSPARRSTIPDYWVLQGTFLIASAAVILANLVANLLYGLLDPRVRT